MSNLMSFHNVVYKPFIHPTQTKPIVKSCIHPFLFFFFVSSLLTIIVGYVHPLHDFAPSICYHSNKQASCSFSEYVSAGNDPNPSKPNKRKADVLSEDIEYEQPLAKKPKAFEGPIDWAKYQGRDKQPDVILPGNDPNPSKSNKRKADVLREDIEDEQPLAKKPNAFERPIDWAKYQGRDKQPDVIPPDQDNHPITRTTVLEFQEKHEAWLLNHLKELTEMDPTLEVGVEVAALVNLLKLFNFSDDQEKHSLVRTASEGAEKMQEGLAQFKQGQDLLRKAIVQMLQHPPPAARL